MKPPFVYALVDPLNPMEYRYIGMTAVNPLRPLAHLRRRGDLEVVKWIASLTAEHRMYHVIVVETFPADIPVSLIYEAETRHIKTAIIAGHRLTNGNLGGTGGWRHSDETRAEMSRRRRGMKFSAEARANMAAARRFRLPESKEQCQKKRERALRQFAEKPVSAETKEKHRINALGNSYAKGNKSFTGITHATHTRIKLQDAWTPERRTAQAERNREMNKRTLEERIRISEARLAKDKAKLAASGGI